jgi:hypothetical protein
VLLSPQQSGFALRIPDVRIGSELQQERNSLLLPLYIRLGSPILEQPQERCLAFYGAGIWLGTPAQEHTHRFHLCARSRCQQWRHGLVGGCVYFGPFL